MTYKYIVNGIGVESFGDLCDEPLLVCSSKHVAKAIQNSFKRAIKEIAPEDIDAKDIRFYEYEDKNAVFRQVRGELPYELFQIIASSEDNKTDLPELEIKIREIVEKIFDGLHWCMVNTNPINITKLPYI